MVSRVPSPERRPPLRCVGSARGPSGAEITQGRRKTQERLMSTQNLACPPGNGLVGIDGKSTIQERGGYDCRPPINTKDTNARISFVSFVFFRGNIERMTIQQQ